MRKLNAFIHVTLDGFFTDAKADMSWAHRGNDNPEWNKFVAGNAKGGGALVFGRVTYDMMAAIGRATWRGSRIRWSPSA